MPPLSLAVGYNTVLRGASLSVTMPGGGTRPGEEVRDGPHNNNRCGGNRGGVAPTAASLKPRVGLGLSGSGLIMRLLVAASFSALLFSTRPSLCDLKALRGTSGGASMTTPGGAGTFPFSPPRARRTGFSLIRPGLYGTPASIMPLAALFPILFRAAFVLPRPREGGFLMYTRRLRARHLLHKKHNTRRYGHRLAGAPGPSGRGCADFHVGVNFRFTQFSEVHFPLVVSVAHK